uniref:Golgin subfamily A conserved domain-containing protein n=1 Tax=Mandrillus leucophaeus TaxID=9568 RepID=A0A2K5YNI9_MANLE
MLPVDGEERKSEGLDTEVDRGPTSSATLKDLQVRGSGRRCSDPAGQPSKLLPQWGLGAPLPAETAHTHPSPNDCSLYFLTHSSSMSSLLHAPQSPCQEPAVVLDLRSVKISQLNNTIKSWSSVFLFLQEKKSNNEKQSQKAVQIQRLNIQKEKLNTDLYHMKRSLRYFEYESKDLAGCLQHSLQRIAELERALSAVTATQEKKEISTSSRGKAVIEWQLEQSIREQKAWWQQRMRKMSPKGSSDPSVCTLEKEKKHDTRRVEKLERSLSKLKNQRAEPLPLEPPAVPSEVELQHLRKEVERMAGELQAQVDNNQRMSVLIWGQKDRLQEQEERLWEQEERLQQLAEPQSGFEELNNENKSALQLEHQVKELQEKLGEVKETVTSIPHPRRAGKRAPASGEGRGFMDLLEEKGDLREWLEDRAWQWELQGCQRVHHLITEPGGSAKDAAPFQEPSPPRSWGRVGRQGQESLTDSVE